MPLAPGVRLGNYEILAPLGAGGMGAVYRARDLTLEREVAIKVLADAVAHDTERLARFKREAKILAALNHPNIGHIYAVESQALVMELVEGVTIKGPLPVETALNYARQIAGALEAAHEKGIVHRDLKPANVMVTPAGLVKVLDFGLAKSPDDRPAGDPAESPTRTLSMTQAGVILGTAAYMSPEQARGGDVDSRADVWAFGVVLYEMLAGKRAFHGASITEVLADILRSEPDWNALPFSTPPRIRQLLRRCLERDRMQRLQAIGEARIMIDAPDEESPREAKPRSVRLWQAVAAALAVLLMAAAATWRRGAGSEPSKPLMRFTIDLGPDLKLRADEAPLALSADGTVLVAAVWDHGRQGLATHRLDQTGFTPVNGAEGAASPFFSPDGQWIGFNAERKIKKISVRGGTPIPLCDSPGMITPGWGDDGNIIASLGWATSLVRFPAAGGPPLPLTHIIAEKVERRHAWPQVLPGSQIALFTNQHSNEPFDEADTEALSLKTGERRTIRHGGFFARYLPSGHLVWVQQNTLFAAPFNLNRLAITGEAQPVVEEVYNGMDTGGVFCFSQTGSFVYVEGKRDRARSIFWMDSTGKLQALQPAPGVYGFPRFSPDGTHLAFTLSDGHGHEDIWVRDLKREEASRLTDLPGQNQSPVWTPDGSHLVFLSTNKTAPGVYSIRADGSGGAQRLSDGKIHQVPQSISPDGKRLAVATTPLDGVQVWTAPLANVGGKLELGKAEPFLNRPFNTIQPAFSPDGRWLAYLTTEPGKQGLWVVPFPGPGGGWQVSPVGTDPIWSRQRRELFFLANSRTIMVAGYSVHGDALMFDKPRVWSEHPLLDLGSPPVRAYDLASDGNRFAVLLNTDGTAEDPPVTHVTVLLNFFDELRRRVPLAK